MLKTNQTEETMNEFIKYLSLLVCIIAITACSSNNDIISYTPQAIGNISEAKDTIEELTFTQHQLWKPDYIEFNSKYVTWGYGQTSRTQGIAVASGGVAGAESTTITRNANDRVYYNSINKIQLMNWSRKFKKWYVVSLVGQDNKILKHVYYTKSIENAKKFINAFQTIIDFNSRTAAQQKV